MWLAQRTIETDLIVPLDQADTERRRYEIFDLALGSLGHICPLNDLRDVFGDCRIGT